MPGRPPARRRSLACGDHSFVIVVSGAKRPSWLDANATESRSGREPTSALRYRRRMYIALAVAAGIGLAFQAVINSRLRMLLDSALWASLIQVLVGLLLLAVLVAIAREPVPSGAGITRAPWWVWT